MKNFFLYIFQLFLLIISSLKKIESQIQKNVSVDNIEIKNQIKNLSNIDNFKILKKNVNQIYNTGIIKL